MGFDLGFEAKPWEYAGEAAWCFVTLPRKMGREMEEVGRVGGARWQTLLFRDPARGGVTAAVEEGGGDEGETAAGRPGEGGSAKRGLAALRVFVPDDAEGGAFFGGEEVEVAVAIDVEQFDAIELDAGGAAD